MGSFLVGAVPFALIVGKVARGVDVREHGSGNLGATNVLRVLGWKTALITLLLDAAKGAVAIGVTMLVAPSEWTLSSREWLQVGAAIGAMIGHSYSPFAGFRGGKSVATGAGVVAVLTPWAWPVLFATFAIIVAATRLVSLGSVTIALLYPVLSAVLYGDSAAKVAFSAGGAALVVWRHTGNIRRLLRGEEARIEWSRREDGQAVEPPTPGGEDQ